MIKRFNIILFTILLVAASSVNSATGSFSVTASTIASYDVTRNFDFSSVPFTIDGNIKTYNLDDFIVNKKEKQSDLEGMGLVVAIHKYKLEDKTIINIIHL